MPNPSSETSGTRDALIGAALALFAEKGFEGASTREISARAGANIAAISYHFGGKDGLRLACADLIARQILGGGNLPDIPETLDPALAAKLLEDGVAEFATLLLTHASARNMAAFILREVAQPGPVLDHVYQSIFAPMHMRLCRLWSRATGAEADAAETRLVLFSLIGQVVYFRIGQPIVERRLGWARIGDAEALQIVDVIRLNIRALISSAREGK